jgi:hypothetical protein
MIGRGHEVISQVLRRFVSIVGVFGEASLNNGAEIPRIDFPKTW